MKSIDMVFGVRGRFKACVHTGHTYDEDGSIIEEGTVLRESEWGNNLITLGGFQAMLTASSTSIGCVAGTGNTAPAEANVNLVTYAGRYTSQILSSRTYELTPDVDGYYRIVSIYRATFNPGSLGSGAVNIAEAGMAMSDAPISTTGLLCRGLLVDGAGLPITVSLDASTEFLDIYWENTRFIPSTITASQSIDILGVPTAHSYTIQPLYLDPTVTSSGTPLVNIWWGGGSGASSIIGFNPTLTDSSYNAKEFGPRVFTGEISGTLTTGPAGTEVSVSGSNYSTVAYVAGSKQRLFSLNLIPTNGNAVGGIRSFTLKFNFQGWQMRVDPVIQKDAVPARVLRMDFKITLANK